MATFITQEEAVEALLKQVVLVGHLGVMGEMDLNGLMETTTQVVVEVVQTTIVQVTMFNLKVVKAVEEKGKVLDREQQAQLTQAVAVEDLVHT